MRSFLKPAKYVAFLFFIVLINSGIAGGQDTPIWDSKYIPDIGTFMKIGYSGDPQYNNSTGEVLFTTRGGEVAQIFRLTHDGWPYQLTVFDDGVRDYQVSRQGDKAIVRARAGGTEDYQLYLMDTKTGRVKQITDNPEVRYESVKWNKDGTGIYYAANIVNPRDRYIYYHDLATGDVELVFEMEGSNDIADISHDGSILLLYHSYSNVADDIYMVNLETGDSRMITPGKGDILYDTPRIMPDNNTVYLTSNDNPDGINKRAVLDIETGEIKFLDPENKWTIEGIFMSENRRYMAWLVNEHGYQKLKMHDLRDDKSITAPPLNGYVSNPEVLNDGRVLLRFTSSTAAPDIWMWDFRKPELKKLAHSTYAGIDPDLFTEPELVFYTSFDGLEIPAFLYLPPDYNGEPIPFIIHAHGGPESQFQPYFQRHFQYLLLNGYGLMAPNVRGSMGYGIEYVSMDDYKKRLNSLKDYKAAVEYLKKEGYTKDGMVGIKGTSYGGYVVLGCITEYPDLFDAALDHVGIANFVTFLENTRPYRRHIREAEYGPLSDKEFLKTISPIHKADQIKTPLFVIHGENDPRVPVGEARQIIAAVQEHGGQVDSLIFPDEGHGVGKLSNRLEFYRRMVEFFDKYLKD